MGSWRRRAAALLLLLSCDRPAIVELLLNIIPEALGRAQASWLARGLDMLPPCQLQADGLQAAAQARSRRLTLQETRDSLGAAEAVT